MHFLSREIILHVWCRWWCFLRPFRRNKGQIFQPIAQAWHRNLRSDSVHTGSIGTGVMLVTYWVSVPNPTHDSGAGNKHIWPLPAQNRMRRQASSRPLWVIACYLEIRRVMLVSCPWKYNWLNRKNAGLRSRGGSNRNRDLLTCSCGSVVRALR